MKLDFSVRFLPVHAVRSRSGKCATCSGFSVRHAPDSVCALFRIHCATCSGLCNNYRFQDTSQTDNVGPRQTVRGVHFHFDDDTFGPAHCTGKNTSKHERSLDEGGKNFKRYAPLLRSISFAEHRFEFIFRARHPAAERSRMPRTSPRLNQNQSLNC